MAMADDVWAWCEKAQVFGRTVTVKIKFADFHQVTRSRSFPAVITRHDSCGRQASNSCAPLPTAKGIRLSASPCELRAGADRCRR